MRLIGDSLIIDIEQADRPYSLRLASSIASGSRRPAQSSQDVMQRAGVWPDIRERALAHVTQGVEGVYDGHGCLSEKLDALTGWPNLPSAGRTIYARRQAPADLTPKRAANESRPAHCRALERRMLRAVATDDPMHHRGQNGLARRLLSRLRDRSAPLNPRYLLLDSLARQTSSAGRRLTAVVRRVVAPMTKSGHSVPVILSWSHPPGAVSFLLQ